MVWTVHPWVPQSVKVTGHTSGVSQLSLAPSSGWKWFCFIPDPPGTGTLSICRLALGSLGRTGPYNPLKSQKELLEWFNPFSSPTFAAFGFPGCGNSGTANMIPSSWSDDADKKPSTGRGCISAVEDLGPRCCGITQALTPPGHPRPRVGAASPSRSPYPWGAAATPPGPCSSWWMTGCCNMPGNNHDSSSGCPGAGLAVAVVAKESGRAASSGAI